MAKEMECIIVLNFSHRSLFFIIALMSKQLIFDSKPSFSLNYFLTFLKAIIIKTCFDAHLQIIKPGSFIFHNSFRYQCKEASFFATINSNSV
jgi:hypothetical protein